jgi:hypothetical protein
MNAASNNLGAIVRDHDLWLQSNIRSSAVTRRLSKMLLLHENMISNLNFRAKAFVGRMDNEIKCVSAHGERNQRAHLFSENRQLTMFD